MELIRGLHNLRARHRGCVATIGNFDGVHLGHQAVLGQLASMSAESNLPATVIIFEPQPQEFFARDKAPARLTRFREKIQALRRYSVQRVLCLRFDDRLAHTPPGEFIQRLLVEGLAVRRLVVGDDFRFGYRREGNFSLLQQAGEQYDFQVVAMHSYSVEGVRVSSTRVREALAQGDLEAAQKWLGRPYRMAGRVARGDRRGSALGFPTANIHVHRMVSPVAGVFAVEVYGLEREPLEGVANVGTRPTVDGTRCLLEVHVLDFGQDIYGRHVQVEFLHKLRDEQRFASLDELKNAIARDCEQAREFFRKTVASS
ncbi:MAG: bifunctional riboflavin kinase/FAD synthetase [Gammaproteobacteria bacterium]